MPLDTATVDALHDALDDEYRARATYQSVIDRFGPVRPFISIIEAEQRHADALLALFSHFGIEPPQDIWIGRVQAPATLADACRAGIAAEIENGKMYERLLDQITNTMVRDVMKQLQQASQNRHLPAFRRCLERETQHR